MNYTNNYNDHYAKNTNFIIIDVSNRYIPFDKALTIEHKLIYLNKNADEGQVAFAFYTLNNSIQILKQSGKYLIKYYNCNHIQPLYLSGMEYEKLENDLDCFQYQHYYPNLIKAIESCIKQIIEDELNITVYGYFETQYCSDEFIIENENDELIKAARLRTMYRSKTTLFTNY